MNFSYEQLALGLAHEDIELSTINSNITRNLSVHRNSCLPTMIYYLYFQKQVDHFIFKIDKRQFTGQM